MTVESRVWERLRGVTDPEYPLSIVDLGMVYAVRADGGVIVVTMTFTSIGCPAIEMLVTDVREAVGALPEVRDVRVDVVWSPPWSKERISEQGRRVLAMYGVVC